MKDLEKLKIPARIVDKEYIPSSQENLLALKVGIMWIMGEFIDYADYHVIVKRQDGYWYSKFGKLAPEKLPLNTNIEKWNWRDINNEVPKNHYNSEIVYIAIQRY